MAFYNKYPNRKDWRKRKRIGCDRDRFCNYCLSNRRYRYNRELDRVNYDLNEYYILREDQVIHEVS